MVYLISSGMIGCFCGFALRWRHKFARSYPKDFASVLDIRKTKRGHYDLAMKTVGSRTSH